MFSVLKNLLRDIVYPGLDLHTHNRASLCRFWTKGPRDVLDAGSGNGFFSWLAYRSGANVMGLNFESGQVEKAREFLIGYRKADPARLHFEPYNLYNLNRESRTFDEIICYEVLEHLSRDTEVVKEFFRVLRPGGVLHICCPNRLHRRHQAEVLDLHETGGHVRAGYTEDDFRRMLEPLGFKIERVVGIGPESVYLVDRIIRIIRNRIGDLGALPLLPLGLLIVTLARFNPPVPFSIYVKAVKPGQPKRRVLLVTSSYAPTMIADMHRARQLAWEMPKLGWDVEVLAPNREFQRPACVDPSTNVFFNPDVVCHEVTPRDLPFFQSLHVRSIGWRALWPLYRTGAKLLAEKKFDLIYITTANFVLFLLGRFWFRRFGIPYVLDYHDPWVRTTHKHVTTQYSWKLGINRWLSPQLESFAIGQASGLVAVSPVYIDELRARYGKIGCLRPGYNQAIPFAGSERDFECQPAPAATGERTIREIAYVGAGGSIMARSFETICRALAALRQRDPSLVDSIRIRLYGTFAFWNEGDPKPLEDLARRHGLGDLVREIPPWIGYRFAMEKIQQADGVLVLGVDDCGYVPSKLFNYALTKKPLLACFRSDSPAGKFFHEIPRLGHLMTFPPDDRQATTAQTEIIRAFLIEVQQQAVIDRSYDMTGYLAPAMAQRHADLFEACLEPEA